MIDDDRLDEVLASIGPLLVLDPVAAPAAAAITGDRPKEPRASRPRRPRRWVLVGVALAALGSALSPLPGAVADWLGIGTTRIQVRPGSDLAPPELPGIDTGAIPITSRRASTLLGQGTMERLAATDLGAPAGFATIAEGGVLAVWADGTTLWVHGAQIGTGGWLRKLVATDRDVQRVDGLGDDALAVVGDHILETPQRTIRASTTVLWTRGGTEFRLAGGQPVDLLIDVARQVDAD